MFEPEPKTFLKVVSWLKQFSMHGIAGRDRAKKGESSPVLRSPGRLEFAGLRKRIRRTRLGRYLRILRGRQKPGLCLVNLRWYLGLKLRRMMSHRIKVGFGPIRTMGNTLGTRKWHIDPIVEWINKQNGTYVSDAFLDGSSLRGYDIIVFVKHMEYISSREIERLKARNKRLIYRATDYLLEDEDTRHSYAATLGQMDAFLISNPLQAKDVTNDSVHIEYIPSPFINTLYKTEYGTAGGVTLIWQGYWENAPQMARLHPIVERLAEEYPGKVQLLYHTNAASKDEGTVKYVQWHIDDWERMLVDSDIAVAIKSLDDDHQQRKPPTKVISYMAAGLPVVCTPSESDRLVIEHGRTGFFAVTDEEWYDTLHRLVLDRELRETVGRAARAFVREHFDLDQIARKYWIFFDYLRGSERQGPSDQPQ